MKGTPPLMSLSSKERELELYPSQSSSNLKFLFIFDISDLAETCLGYTNLRKGLMLMIIIDILYSIGFMGYVLLTGDMKVIYNIPLLLKSICLGIAPVFAVWGGLSVTMMHASSMFRGEKAQNYYLWKSFELLGLPLLDISSHYWNCFGIDRGQGESSSHCSPLLLFLLMLLWETGYRLLCCYLIFSYCTRLLRGESMMADLGPDYVEMINALNIHTTSNMPMSEDHFQGDELGLGRGEDGVQGIVDDMQLASVATTNADNVFS